MDILTRFYFITKFYTNCPYYVVAIFFSLKLGTKLQYYGVIFGLGWGRERKMFYICSMICRDFLQNVLGFIYLDICSWMTKKQKNLINWGLSGQNSVYFPLPDLPRTLQKRLKRFNRPRCFESFFRVKNFERASIICHAFEVIFQKCPKML